MYNIKCVVVGNSNVGKTSLLHTYVNGVFETSYAPTVFDKHDVTIDVSGNTLTLGLVDTAGQEGFDRLRPLSYVDSDVFLVCFSLSDHESFLNCKAKWIPEVLHHEERTPFVCVGTKLDARDLIHTESKDTKWYSRECSKLGAFDYVECSAKEQEGLDGVMMAVGRAAMESLRRFNKLDQATVKPANGGKKGGKGKVKAPKASSTSSSAKKKSPCVLL